MPLEVALDYDRGVPVYRQIYESVIAALSAGALARDEQLPTIHELARRLEVNPNTVARAYRELEKDGYLVAKRGRGTFPSQAAKLPARDRKLILRGIFDRAMAEAARHRISSSDVIGFFKKEEA